MPLALPNDSGGKKSSQVNTMLCDTVFAVTQEDTYMCNSDHQVLKTRSPLSVTYHLH